MSLPHLKRKTELLKLFLSKICTVLIRTHLCIIKIVLKLRMNSFKTQTNFNLYTYVRH